MTTKSTVFFNTFSSVFGIFTVVWRDTELGPRLQRVYLPQKNVQTELIVKKGYGDIQHQKTPQIDILCDQIQRAVNGEEVDFDLDVLALENCSAFQRKVLLAEYGIPRGFVSTYGRIASFLKTPGGARAVGSALANNPFSICIPCHRAVSSDGVLGGYQGGLAMKRALLEREGVRFSEKGKVLLDRIFY